MLTQTPHDQFDTAVEEEQRGVTEVVETLADDAGDLREDVHERP